MDLAGGLMSRRAWWVTVFLGGTVLVVGEELWASFDASDNTVPWTDLIVQHIPGEVTAALLGALITWLPIHFAIRYWRRRRRGPSA